MNSLVVLAVVSSVLWWVAAPASAVQARQPSLVSALPAAGTPNVNDGRVFAIAQVGSQIILGGTFTSVSPADSTSTTYSLPNTFGFDAATGAINTAFQPAVNGKVDAAIPGPRPNEVYIAGGFTTVNGTSMRVALLNTTTGALVSSWQPSSMNGTINKLVRADGKLFVGGDFTMVGGEAHRGLVALNPSTGKVTSYVGLAFLGHHNYRTQCDPAKEVCAPGMTGIKSMDINPAGTRLVAIGDFIDVSGQSRDQIVMIDLGKSSAAVDRHWATLAYTSACHDASFDSYVRDVQFSPDGAYFVVAATGGGGTNRDGTNSSCDSAARYGTKRTGSNVRPKWIDYTGEDTLSTVAITGSVVYVGGHQRWLNNTLGDDVASPGSVPRPGIAALSPVNGLPYSWNPGRNPRGAGCFALLATSQGLWIGSDTNYIGNRTYLRQKVAFFPLAGGETPPKEPTPKLPGRVYLAGATTAAGGGPDRLAFREFNGKTTGSEIPLTTGIPWGSIRGAFTVNGQVIYGGSDGNLYERSFDGTSFGSQVELDPYDDPKWDNVQTGSGQTYQGQPSTFLSEIPSVTSMFFSAGRLFYTIGGEHAIHWRWFEPESGVVGSDEFTVSGGMDVSHVAGAFLAGRRLFFSSQTNGELWSVAWSGKATTGKRTLVDRSTDWASRGLFLLSNTTDPTPTPTAAFTVNCGTSATCRFRAARWVDPDGGVVKYKWNFGDGTRRPSRTSTTASHRYSTNGIHHVTLTVTDTSGASASKTQQAAVNANVEKVEFVAASKAADKGKKAHLTVPRAASAGNALVLFVSYGSASARARVPAGWRMVGRTHRRGLTTGVYDEVAARHRVPKSVTLRFSRAVHSNLILAVYRHTAAKPIQRSAVAVGHHLTRIHQAPELRHLAAGSVVVGYWTERSKPVTTWITPRALKRRIAVRGHARPATSAVVADSGAPRQGTYRLGPAKTSKAVRSAVRWAVALAPALS